MRLSKVMEASKRFAKCIKDAVSADRFRQVVAVQVGPQVRLHMREHQLNTTVSQVFPKFSNHPRGGIVHMGDCSCVYHEPS